MKRPCDCNRAKAGEPFEQGQCRLCWLALNDARYQRLWTQAADPRPKKAQAPIDGPGTELRRLLKELGVTEFAGCGCANKAKQMNAWGVAGCREHFAEIRTWLDEAAAKASWLDKIRAAGNAVAAGILIDPRDVLASLITIAIERARVHGH
jgi:hypothetical protein